MKILRQLDAAILSILYPRDLACLCCGEPTYGEPICKACADQLETLRMQAPLCEACGGSLQEDGSCARCGKYGPLQARSVWLHRGAPAILVRHLKDHAVEQAAEQLSEGLAGLISSLSLGKTCILTWVTMPAHRKRQRGIDHGRILAEQTAQRLDLPCRQLLNRKDDRSAHTQRGLSGAQRQKNLQDAFTCSEQLYGTVVLIDDVMTTGATGAACAEALRAAGARRVIVITATRA